MLDRRGTLGVSGWTEEIWKGILEKHFQVTLSFLVSLVEGGQLLSATPLPLFCRFYVPTRTSTQIASHAQKYLQRITGATKRKSKFTEIEQQVSGQPRTLNALPYGEYFS